MPEHPLDGNSRIGVFDSGFGGLSIFRHIQERMPDHDYVYLGDNARSPYGNRSFDSVLKFTTEGVDFLFRRGCRLVIVACNTASARALRTIQRQWLPREYARDPELRVLGVIRPTIETLATMRAGETIALWGTSGTVRSDSFGMEVRKYAIGVDLIQTACPVLVPLIEAGELEGAGTEHFVRKYWAETEALAGSRRIDSLLLACTHYPLLLPVLKKVIPSRVRILSQGELVANSLVDYLRRHPEMAARLSKNRSAHFCTTDQCDFFDHLAEVFMGHPVASEKVDVSGSPDCPRPR